MFLLPKLSFSRTVNFSLRAIKLTELIKACLLKVFAQFAAILGAQWRAPPTVDGFFFKRCQKGLLTSKPIICENQTSLNGSTIRG